MSKMLKVIGASWLQTKISSYILGLLGVISILALFIGQQERIHEDGTYAATVFHSEKMGYRIEYWGQSNDLADIPRGVARAYFRMDYETVGWSILEIETEGSYPDAIQAYAAGIVEGALTWYLIHTHLENTIRAKCEGTLLEKQCDKLKDALERSVNIWKSYATEHEDEYPFWHQVSLYYIQISGVFTGWQHGVERSQNEYDTDISDLYWLNAIAESTEIQHKLNISLDDPILDRLPTASSAFLRIVNETDVNGNEDMKLYVAHNSAGSLNSMMKILKRYKLNYRQTAAKDSPRISGKSVEFSGYPGSITSQDEFYLLKGADHNLVVTGTPLKNYNDKLWKDVNITEQVPVGPRVTAANHLATNVSSWGHLLATSNSGTGSKQWLIIDYQKFDQLASNKALPIGRGSSFNTDLLKTEVVTEVSPSGKTKNMNMKHTVVHRSGGASLFKGLLWVVEQVPARTHSADLSDFFLEQTYFATHGIPIFKDISELTRYNVMEEQYGDIFSETQSPRALMFKRGFKSATSLDSIIKLLRQNNMTALARSSNETICTDDMFKCILDVGYWSALGVRGDIIDKYPLEYAVTDTKVVSSFNFSLRMTAVSGPPFTDDPNTNITEIEDIPLNKATAALVPLYTDQFDNAPNIDGLEIRDLVKHHQEEVIEEYLENIDMNVITPFQWSDSHFSKVKHESLPDKWAFNSLNWKWSW